MKTDISTKNNRCRSNSYRVVDYAKLQASNRKESCGRSASRNVAMYNIIPQSHGALWIAIEPDWDRVSRSLLIPFSNMRNAANRGLEIRSRSS